MIVGRLYQFIAYCLLNYKEKEPNSNINLSTSCHTLSVLFKLSEYFSLHYPHFSMCLKPHYWLHENTFWACIFSN